MKVLIMMVGVVSLSACASAASRIDPGTLGLTARDGYVEARSVAASWSGQARLRYVQGDSIAPTGAALPDRGVWRFHYTAPDRTGELMVTVTPLAVESEERPVTSPPGYIIGDFALDTSWLDSPRALEGIAAEVDGQVESGVSMLLVPTRPNRWVVRTGDQRVEIHAETGEVLRS